MNRCGKCEKWMKKPDCPRENVGQKPSSKDLPCKEFALVKWANYQLTYK